MQTIQTSEKQTIKDHFYWTNGEKQERSQRLRPIISKEQPIQNHISADRCLLENDDMLSLKHYNDDWVKTNKREESYNKMSEREMIGQRGYNPFNPTTNYFDNLLEHEKYVKNN
jgi:hypothetical protein